MRPSIPWCRVQATVASEEPAVIDWEAGGAEEFTATLEVLRIHGVHLAARRAAAGRSPRNTSPVLARPLQRRLAPGRARMSGRPQPRGFLLYKAGKALDAGWLVGWLKIHAGPAGRRPTQAPEVNMLKIALTAFFTTCGLSAAFFFAGPKIFYSGFQPKWPIGSGVKVVPDPTNIWSWHFENLNAARTGKVEIVIDQNGDGKPDQLDSFLAVLLTDIQFDSSRKNGTTVIRCILSTTGGTEIWNASGMPYRQAAVVSQHFATPLVFPRGKRVFLEWTSGQYTTFSVHAVGRTVNL